MTGGIDVLGITAEQTHDLRRRVLRDGAADADVRWVGDDDDGTVHLGAVLDAQLVAVSTWLVARDPLAPALHSVQLRGMATDPAHVGRGVGRALHDAGLRRAAHDGADRVWANARVTALAFYERAGMTVSGPVFVTEATGLPHRHVHVDLD